MNKKSFREIPAKKIREAAQKIAQAVHPKKIVLFGSYAYGKPTEDCDVDLFLIVNDKTRAEQYETYCQTARAIRPYPFPVDIVVRSKSEVQWRVREGDFFLQDVLEKGRVLYEQ